MIEKRVYRAEQQGTACTAARSLRIGRRSGRRFVVAVALATALGYGFYHSSHSSATSVRKAGLRETTGTEMCRAFIRALTSPDQETRSDAYVQFVRGRAPLAERLVAIARRSKENCEDYDPRLLAIMLLSRVRSRDGIGVLVENIDWRPAVEPLTSQAARMPDIAGYPAAESLCDIGLASASAVLWRAVSDPHVADETTAVCAKVYHRIFRQAFGPHGLREARLEAERFALHRNLYEYRKRNLTRFVAQLEELE